MTEKTLLDRYIIEPATLEDSRQILDIYEEEAAPGNPALIFTRRDNAILSMQREGEQVVIFVCRNKFNNELIGFGAYSINSCFVNGTVCPVAYLFGLKCRKSYRNRAARAIPIIYNRIRLDLESKGIDNVLTTILSENLPARKFLTKSHRDMPRYTLLGKYEVFALCPLKQSRKKLPEGIVCEPAHITGRLRLENFLQTHGCKRNFFPVTNI
jgi:hypothetical protein